MAEPNEQDRDVAARIMSGINHRLEVLSDATEASEWVAECIAEERIRICEAERWCVYRELVGLSDRIAYDGPWFGLRSFACRAVFSLSRKILDGGHRG